MGQGTDVINEDLNSSGVHPLAEPHRVQSALLELSLGSTGVGGLGGGSESTEMPNLAFTSLALLCPIVKASGMSSCHLILASALTASSCLFLLLLGFCLQC